MLTMQYELCLEMASKLEVIKERHLQDSPIVKSLAGLIYKYEILDLPYLNKIAGSLLAAGSGRKEEPTIELTPESLMYCDLLREDLRPWVQKLRKKYFGVTEAPFTSYNTTVDWIRQYDVCETPWKDNPGMMQSEPHRRNIRFFEHDGEVVTVFARINSPLEKIIFASQKLVKELKIGLELDSLIFYVLADIPPYIPPVEVGIMSYIVRLPSGRYINYSEAEITIREGFNLAWMRWLYKVLREDMHLTKKKVLNTNHLQLYRLIQNKGGAPKGKGTVVFWKSVMDEWNTSHPKNKYQTWKGVKINYERAISKLRANYIGWLQKEEANHERSHSQEV